jgi:tetratricopeptide (TPR) repeat protein
LLQAASVVGKDVPFPLLQEIAELDDDTLRRGLARLQTAEFVYEARLFPDLEHTFKHALTHEVAYGSLLQERRQGLHRKVLEAIERLYPERLGEHVERLAHHALRGQMRDVAVKYLRQAGDRAAARSANREAATFFEQALGVLAELPETPETLAATADARIALGPALVSIKGPGAPEVEMSYLQTRELAERLGDATRLYPALWGLWYFNYARGHYSAARELGNQLLEVAESGNDIGRLLEAHHALWATLFAMGEPTSALPHLEQGLNLYDPVHHGVPPFLYGSHDAGTCCHFHLARVQWLLGYPDRAAVALRRAVDLADSLAHPLTMVFTLTASAFVHDQLGRARYCDCEGA